LHDQEYAEILHPYNKENKKNAYGVTKIIFGPKTFSLYPNENIVEKEKIRLLVENEALVVQALVDTENHKAGEKWLVHGPCSYFPTIEKQIVELRRATTIGDNESLYVRNMDTCELKLVVGPRAYMCAVDEEPFYKRITLSEQSALKLDYDSSTRGYEVQVQKNECVCIVDYDNLKEKYYLGPCSYTLQPNEGIKTIAISTGVPKKENGLTVGVVRLGPDFMDDRFDVRTLDNAVLELTLTYKWKVIIDDHSIGKLFNSDFIGFSCQSLRSRIRETASHYSFEEFHKNSSSILREKLFKEYSRKVVQAGEEKEAKFVGRFFDEFNFLIFELDIKKLVPVDPEIELLLDQSIKQSMKIMCNKLNDNAEFEGRISKIKNDVEIAKLRGTVIDLEHQNRVKETLHRIKIENEAQVTMEKAKAKAEIDVARNKMKMEIEDIKNIMQNLEGDIGASYLKHAQAANLHKNVNSMTLVPDSVQNLFAPSAFLSK